MKKLSILFFGLTLFFLSSQVLVEQAQATPQTVGNYNPSLSLAPLVEKLSPVVVNIEINGDTMYGQDVQLGQGSGFLISDDGYILTNHHVVQGVSKVTVRLSSEKKYIGKVIGIDDSLDVAVIKIQAKNLPYAKLGKSSDIRVGDWVVAIGNPFGFSHSVTSGIISAKGRALGSGPYDDFLQTDASINPGNSGGPLFNLKGEVVGINTAIDARAQGIGFSVPIDSVQKVLSDLKSKGHASRGWLGIAVASRGGTVVVGDIYPNTPAQKYGLRKGDTILTIDGVKIPDGESLIRKIGKYRANENIKIIIKRNGKRKTINVVLGERPLEKDLSSGAFIQEETPNSLGIQVSQISGFDRRNPDRTALVVLQVYEKGLATQKLRVGDVIISANDKNISTPSDLQNIMKEGVTMLEILRNGRKKEIMIR
jgi:serine protease Do